MKEMQLKTFLPHFSGFSDKWGPLVSDPQRRSAQASAKENGAENGLDADDYMQIFEQMGASQTQRRLLAQKYTENFAIELTHSLESPHGLQFDRYDLDADRIIVTIPLSTVKRFIRLYKLFNLAPLLVDWGCPEAGELDPALTECLHRLDPTFLCSMLGASVEVSIEKRELEKLASEADSVFIRSFNLEKFRALLCARLREKRQVVVAVPHGPVSR